MKNSPQPAKRRRYDAAFHAEALRLASESRSTQAAARALNIDPKRIYNWQKEALTPVAAARGAESDPATAAELHPDAQRSVAAYFDYYNHEKLHSRIDYKIPCHPHQQLFQSSTLNCPA